MTKLNIRLPEDDEHEPNPYDSKTDPKDLLRNRWLWDWRWWTGVVTFAVVAAIVSKINGRW